MSAPVEVKVAAGTVVGGAVAFLAIGLARGAQTLVLPVGAGFLAVAIAVGLLMRLMFVRVITVVVVMVLAVLHVLVLLSEGPWWVRLVSGLLTAAYVYTAVLVNTAPAREYLEPR